MNGPPELDPCLPSATQLRRQPEPSAILVVGDSAFYGGAVGFGLVGGGLGVVGVEEVGGIQHLGDGGFDPFTELGSAKSR